MKLEKYRIAMLFFILTTIFAIFNWINAEILAATVTMMWYMSAETELRYNLEKR